MKKVRFDNLASPASLAFDRSLALPRSNMESFAFQRKQMLEEDKRLREKTKVYIDFLGLRADQERLRQWLQAGHRGGDG
jgi:hypothetical protein